MNRVARIARPSRPGRKLCGFALIEVLVAILIVSFGLLGLAGLQANTAKMKINSWARAAASVQFSDIANRMRSNAAQTGLSFSSPNSAASVSAYSYAEDWNTQQTAALVIAVDCSLASSACSEAQRAAYDMLIWRNEVRRMFPQGSVFLQGNRAVGFNATVAWFDKDSTALSDVCPTTATTGAAQINCCPRGLVGGTGIAGVKCSNFSFVP